jgi:hypothetical protein
VQGLDWGQTVVLLHLLSEAAEELRVTNRRQRAELRLQFQGTDPQRRPAIRTVSRW